MKQKAIICDLDGTLALIGQRSPYNEQEKLIEDEVNWELQKVLSFYEKEGYALLFVTGRWEEYLDLTKHWLTKKANLTPTEIFMRPAVNYDNARILKQWYVENVIQQRYDVFVSFEDVYAIAKMYREHGFPCWLVNSDPWDKETV